MINKTFDIALNTTVDRGAATDIVVNQGDYRSIIFNFRVYKGAEEEDYGSINNAVLVLQRHSRQIVRLTTAPHDVAGYTVIAFSYDFYAVSVRT